jgi:homoserine dehydrogenase
VAEADPGEDVEGWDAVAKLMILAALVFGRQLASDEVERRGIDELRTAEPGGRAGSRTVVRPVESLVAAEEGTLVARTGPEELDPDDPLAAVTGLGNAVICRCDPLGEVVLTGPGAGPALAGQGVLSDAIALAGSRR